MKSKIQNSSKVTKKVLPSLSLSRHEGVARETMEPPPTTLVGEHLSDRWSQQMEDISCEGGTAHPSRISRISVSALPGF